MMHPSRSNRWRLFIMVLWLGVVTGPLLSDSESSGGALDYLPPVEDAPDSRTSAASRGPGDPLPGIRLHAPSKIGWTLDAAPTLYWHLTQPTTRPVRFTMTRPRTPQPLIDLTVSGVRSNGVMSVNLADFGVVLEPETAYRWSVAIQQDGGTWHTSQAMVVRVQPPASLKDKDEIEDPAERVGALIRHRIWYDAVDVLNRRIAAEPTSTRLIELRTDLLRDVYPSDQPEAAQAVAPPVAEKPAPSTTPAPAPQEPLTFALPKIDSAPRSGLRQAGVRTRGEQDTTLSLLAPLDHEGLTQRAAPTLMWFISKPTRVQFRLVLSEPGEPAPLIEVVLDGSGARGIQSLDLDAYGIELEIGRTYRWGVAMVGDPTDGRDQAVAMTTLRRVESKTLDDKLSQSPARQRAHLLAEHGIWYDALAELTDRMEAGVDVAQWRALRSRLLDEAGHPDAATFDASR